MKSAILHTIYVRRRFHVLLFAGPGGQRIRKIRNESKANITIEDVQAGSNERLITIEGTEGQISVARYLLRQAVNEQRPVPGGFNNTGY